MIHYGRGHTIGLTRNLWRSFVLMLHRSPVGHVGAWANIDKTIYCRKIGEDRYSIWTHRSEELSGYGFTHKEGNEPSWIKRIWDEKGSTQTDKDDLG